MQKRPVPTRELQFPLEALPTPKGQLLAPLGPESKASAYGVAPGDLALCMVGGKKKGARQSWLRQVLEPGVGRQEAPCPHFGFCGGCSFQHLNYQRQLRLKTGALEERLRQLEEGVEIWPAQGAPTPWYYRSKVEFSFIKEDLGFNLRGLFQKVTPVRECLIAPPSNRQILERVRQWQKKYALPGWDPRLNEGLLRYLIVRYSFYKRQFLVALVTTTPAPQNPAADPALWQELAQSLMAIPGAQGVIHVYHDGLSPVASGQSEELLAGKEEIIERVNDLEFSLGWRSFFQSNPPAYAQMLAQARRWVGPQEKILDLYCGVGSIGLSLEGDLVGVESVPQAIANAQANARRLGRKAQFHCANSEDWPDLKASLIIIDPPRSGCHPSLIQRLLKEGSPTLLYISCNFSRFWEEYQSLKEAYRLERVQFYDFFPHTPHLESLLLLRRRP